MKKNLIFCGMLSIMLFLFLSEDYYANDFYCKYQFDNFQMEAFGGNVEVSCILNIKESGQVDNNDFYCEGFSAGTNYYLSANADHKMTFDKKEDCPTNIYFGAVSHTSPGYHGIHVPTYSYEFRFSLYKIDKFVQAKLNSTNGATYSFEIINSAILTSGRTDVQDTEKGPQIKYCEWNPSFSTDPNNINPNALDYQYDNKIKQVNEAYEILQKQICKINANGESIEGCTAYYPLKDGKPTPFPKYFPSDEKYKDERKIYETEGQKYNKLTNELKGIVEKAEAFSKKNDCLNNLNYSTLAFDLSSDDANSEGNVVARLQKSLLTAYPEHSGDIHDFSDDIVTESKEFLRIAGKLINQGNLSGCHEIISKELDQILAKYWSWIQIIAPILLILFGSADFGMAVVSENQDALKKATSKFVKRAIATLLIFFIPLIVKVFFQMFISYSEGESFGDVKICFFEREEL